MKNTDYKFKPFRGTQRTQSPSYRHTEEMDTATQDEQKHLQKKVQELVWFFQNGSKPRHTKKNSSNKSPNKSHGLQTQATSTSSLYQSQPSKRNLNTLKAAIGRSTKSPARIFKIPPSRSNEQLSLNSGQISSRQMNKRAVGSMVHSSTSQTLHGGSAGGSVARTRKQETTPMKKKAGAAHHFSQSSAHSDQQQHYYEDSSFERNEQESKREETEEERHRPYVEERREMRSRSPMRRSEVKDSGIFVHSNSLAQTRSRQAASQHHTFGAHQHNNTVDEASLKAALGGREDRHTPLKGRLSVGKSRKSFVQAESVRKSRSNSGANSRRSSMSPNRSQMLHFALFKDQANVKYGCVPVSDESMNYPSKAFKTFISSMAQDGTTPLPPAYVDDRTGVPSRVSEELDGAEEQRLVRLRPQLDEEIEEPGQIEAPMPMSPPRKFQDPRGKGGAGIQYEGYFNTERAQRAMEKYETGGEDDSGEAIENILQKQQQSAERQTMEIQTASRDFLPTPVKEKMSPERGGGSTRRSEGYGATPATAADEAAAMEREHDQEGLSPVRQNLYQEQDLDESGLLRSSIKKKKPTTFCFSRGSAGSGVNYKARASLTGEVIQESAVESEALQSPPPQYQEVQNRAAQQQYEPYRAIRTEESEESTREYDATDRRLTKKKRATFKVEEEERRKKALMESEGGLDLLASGGLDEDYGLARLDSKDRMKLGSIASSAGSELRLGYKKKSEDVFSFGSVVGGESGGTLMKSQQTFGREEECDQRRTMLRESPNFPAKERNNKTPLRQAIGLDSARDSVLTQKIGRMPTFSNVEGLDIAPEKRERWSQETGQTKFQELRNKLGSPQATLSLFNAIQKEVREELKTRLLL